MASPLIIGAAVAVGTFVLLRLLMGRSSSYSSRHGSAKDAKSALAKVESYENRVNRLQRVVRAAPSDRARELAAKKLEKLLREKERLKIKAERLTRKA